MTRNFLATQPLSAVPAEVMVVTVGKLPLILYPGEVFVEYGLELKQQFPLVPQAGEVIQHVITSLLNEALA